MTTVSKENIGNYVMIASVSAMIIGVGFSLTSVMNIGAYDESHDTVKMNSAKTKAKISFGLAGVAAIVLFAKMSSQK